MWKFAFNATKAAWSRLCAVAGTEWELPEGEVLALKHVEAISKEQYSKTASQVCICLFFVQ